MRRQIGINATGHHDGRFPYLLRAYIKYAPKGSGQGQISAMELVAELWEGTEVPDVVNGSLEAC